MLTLRQMSPCSKSKMGKKNEQNINHILNTRKKINHQVCSKQAQWAYIQYLDGAIKWCTCESVEVFWVEFRLHYIMWMSLKGLCTLPILLPIPQLYKLVIRCRQHEWESRMDSQRPYVIFMCLKFLDTFHCVIIEDAYELVIGTTNDPVLSCYKLGCPHCRC